MTRRPFHLAFPVSDIETTIEFYHCLLGCPLGRRATKWVDFDFFGNQVSAHQSDKSGGNETNPVDGDAVPVRHFGAILEWGEWETLARKLKKEGVGFIIEPKIRFKGKPGEQGTFFVSDPSGNALEFKTFRSMKSVYAGGENYDQ